MKIKIIRNGSLAITAETELEVAYFHWLSKSEIEIGFDTTDIMHGDGLNNEMYIMRKIDVPPPIAQQSKGGHVRKKR